MATKKKPAAKKAKKVQVTISGNAAEIRKVKKRILAAISDEGDVTGQEEYYGKFIDYYVKSGYVKDY
jgi:hypothetical protein